MSFDELEGLVPPITSGNPIIDAVDATVTANNPVPPAEPAAAPEPAADVAPENSENIEPPAPDGAPDAAEPPAEPPAANDDAEEGDDDESAMGELAAAATAAEAAAAPVPAAAPTPEATPAAAEPVVAQSTAPVDPTAEIDGQLATTYAELDALETKIKGGEYDPYDDGAKIQQLQLQVGRLERQRSQIHQQQQAIEQTWASEAQKHGLPRTDLEKLWQETTADYAKRYPDAHPDTWTIAAIETYERSVATRKATAAKPAAAPTRPPPAAPPPRVTTAAGAAAVPTTARPRAAKVEPKTTQERWGALSGDALNDLVS